MTTSISIAKLVGLTGAAWLSGTIASISLVSVPAISRSIKEENLSAAHAVKLWRNTFEAGFALAPPIAVATASSLAFCAWKTPRLVTLGVPISRLFAVAAALTVGIVPYTVLLMKATNDKLLRFAKKAEKEELSALEGEESVQLLRRWTLLNGVRSLLPLTGAVITGIVVLA